MVNSRLVQHRLYDVATGLGQGYVRPRMDIQRFHQDLKAATFAGAPVELAEKWRLFGNKLTLNRIDQLEKRVVSLVGKDSSSDDRAPALKSNTELPNRQRCQRWISTSDSGNSGHKFWQVNLVFHNVR